MRIWSVSVTAAINACVDLDQQRNLVIVGGIGTGKTSLTVVEPERQVAVSPQSGLICRPGRHPVAGFQNAMAAGVIVFEGHLPP